MICRGEPMVHSFWMVMMLIMMNCNFCTHSISPKILN